MDDIGFSEFQLVSGGGEPASPHSTRRLDKEEEEPNGERGKARTMPSAGFLTPPCSWNWYKRAWGLIRYELETGHNGYGEETRPTAVEVDLDSNLDPVDAVDSDILDPVEAVDSVPVDILDIDP